MQQTVNFLNATAVLANPSRVYTRSQLYNAVITQFPQIINNSFWLNLRRFDPNGPVYDNDRANVVFHNYHSIAALKTWSKEGEQVNSDSNALYSIVNAVPTLVNLVPPKKSRKG